MLQDDVKDTVFEQLVKLCPNLFKIIDRVDENAEALLDFCNYLGNILEFLLVRGLLDAQVHADKRDHGHDECVEVYLACAMSRYLHNDFEYARLGQIIEEINLLQNCSDGATSQNCTGIFF